MKRAFVPTSSASTSSLESKIWAVIILSSGLTAIFLQVIGQMNLVHQEVQVFLGAWKDFSRKMNFYAHSDDENEDAFVDLIEEIEEGKMEEYLELLKKQRLLITHYQAFLHKLDKSPNSLQKLYFDLHLLSQFNQPQKDDSTIHENKLQTYSETILAHFQELFRKLWQSSTKSGSSFYNYIAYQSYLKSVIGICMQVESSSESNKEPFKSLEISAMKLLEEFKGLDSVLNQADKMITNYQQDFLKVYPSIEMDQPSPKDTEANCAEYSAWISIYNQIYQSLK